MPARSWQKMEQKFRRMAIFLQEPRFWTVGETGEVTDVAFDAAETFQSDEDEILYAGALTHEENDAEAMRTQPGQAKEAQPQETDAETTLVPVVAESGGIQRGPHAEGD